MKKEYEEQEDNRGNHQHTHAHIIDAHRPAQPGTHQGDRPCETCQKGEDMASKETWIGVFSTEKELRPRYQSCSQESAEHGNRVHPTEALA